MMSISEQLHLFKLAGQVWKKNPKITFVLVGVVGFIVLPSEAMKQSEHYFLYSLFFLNTAESFLRFLEAGLTF